MKICAYYWKLVIEMQHNVSFFIFNNFFRFEIINSAETREFISFYTDFKIFGDIVMFNVIIKLFFMNRLTISSIDIIFWYFFRSCDHILLELRHIGLISFNYIVHDYRIEIAYCLSKIPQTYCLYVKIFYFWYLWVLLLPKFGIMYVWCL